MIRDEALDVSLANQGWSRRMSADLQREVDANYDAFRVLLPSLLVTHGEQYALMKGGQILGFFSSAMDARTAAESFIPDKIYSIQRVTDTAVDLGFYSHAMHRDPV
jgi:hypothetical protein